uniref:NADH-ubiquinone oxidoreductase chain 1 n=1 Tax=Spathius agrili TaxID=314331 RepID=D8KZU7_SPAAG|nr:NADH dehydrogenase subunit 1 [Spathius agrili]ACJ06266.1 NADH dehydrogenase subunit 1 [Spathius agrili]
MKQLEFYLFCNLIMLFLMLLVVMVSVAFLTLLERKILSYSHYRKGPNKVGVWGMFQPFSDAMKLLTKEFFLPKKSNYYFYILSPMIMFTLTMSMWLIYPFFYNLINLPMNSLFFLCLVSMGVYGLMISGWSSNSSFSMIGAIRSIAQSISYEVTFAISLLLTLILCNSMNLLTLNYFQKYFWLIIFMWPSSMILFISMLAEINRTPFDLSEGESELVSGFNIEYSSGGFVLIFLAEYSSILFMMFLFMILFINMNYMQMYFYVLYLMFLYLIIWIRVSLPRIRYDYLMYMCWFYLLPYTLIMFSVYLFFKFFMNLLMMNYIHI